MKYSYEEVIDKIQNARRFGNHTGYEVSNAMLQQLGNPQEGIPFVHVAGTNGKGSTTAFLCKILEQSGKRIGMFTSPHLVDFEERIRINGAYIPREDVCRLGNRLLEAQFPMTPTMFDYCMLMAVLYFKEQQCDVMVMETGIGGRYDSTNALGNPVVSVITGIGFDHMAVLGDSLTAIAGEKAGIIKKGCPVVVALQKEEVTAVLRRAYDTVNSLEDTKNVPPVFWQVTKQDMEYVSTLPRKMLGRYQAENAATAMLAAKAVLPQLIELRTENGVAQKAADKDITDKYIKAGIAQAGWAGRMELICENPFFLIDGAHNSHGVHALAESLRELYPGEKFHFVMAVMADKDYEDMIQELLPLAVDFKTVTVESSRALQAGKLAQCIEAYGVPASSGQNIEDIMEMIFQGTLKCEEKTPTGTDVTQKCSKTVAFGSLYFIGEIKKICYSSYNFLQ